MMRRLTVVLVTILALIIFTSVPLLAMDRAVLKLNAYNLASPPYSLTGQGVVVGVHDLLHAFRHTDFFSRWTQGDAAVQALSVHIHPSMTAGTIAGDGSVNIQYMGFAPEADLETYAFQGNTRLADISLMLNRGIDIANNSWGFFCNEQPYGDYTADARVYDRFVLGMDPDGNAIGNPTVVVFSAGNERDGSQDDEGNLVLDCITNTSAPYINYGTINQPKPAKNIIVVGAIDSANDRMSGFSSWGPVSDGRLKPDIVAVGLHNGTVTAGVSEIFTWPCNGNTCSLCFGNPIGAANQQCYRTTSSTNTNSGSTSWDDRYAWFSQTSAAAAEVSGSAALIMEDFRAQNFGATPLPSTVKALLIHTATDLDDATSWYNPGPDFASGYGLVNIQKAIDQLRTNGWVQACFAEGNTLEVPLNVPVGTTQVKATLVWDDVPGALSTTAPVLVNDLDLIVTDASGVRRYPWTLDPSNPSANAVRMQEDHLNNVEVVLADGMIPSGSWTIQVAGTSIPSAPQCFSLIYEPVAAAEVCDVDEDGDIDTFDIRAILSARYSTADPDDPRDADGDGTITPLDAKICIQQCTNPRCAPSNG
jgi:hypothetical protein